MQLSKKQAVIIMGGGVLVMIFLAAIILNIRSSGNGTAKVNLLIWGLDDEKALEGVIRDYGTVRPNVTVKYQRIDEAGYDDILLNALAAGEGPDIFMVGNRSLLRHKNKLAPAGPLQMSVVKLRNLFPQVVEQDFVSEGKIYALPLYIDTLALIYNRDLFDQASIVYPPGTWQDFQGSVALLRELGPAGEIKRAGAAIGGSDKSVRNANDILHLLMLQNGVEMVSGDMGKASFGAGSGRKGLGQQAFDFYLQFANGASDYYTWNERMPNSLESFSKEETAMIFDYYDTISSLKEKNPFLNFAASKMPQPAGAEKDVSYAFYHGLAVSKQSKVSGWAWDFVVYAATNQSVVKKYLDYTGRPPALKIGINDKINDPDLGIYVRQALTARSWPQINDLEIEKIFRKAITDALLGRADSGKALNTAEKEVTELMRR